MSKEEFIKAIADAVNKYKSDFGICVASPIIAQAILESAWGTSKKAKYHNYFGLKYRKNRVTCNNGYFEDGGSEQNSDGSYIPLPSNTAWYAFDNLEKGVLGYFQFINIELYSNLKGVSDPYEYLRLIRADGYATSLDYVDNVYRIVKQYDLTQYDKVKEESVMSNSGLVNCTVKSPNHSGKRTHSIDRITPHCVVGQLSAKNIGGCFTSTSRQASCNYGIGTEGDVCLIVDEENRSWCSSSNANDQRAVTIECASDKSEPYAMNSKVYNKLVELCFDICKRNGKTKLLWFADKDKSLSYEPKSNEMVLTVHRWFANKSCPGDWLYNRLGDVAKTVTAKLGGSSESQPTTPTTSGTMYRVQVGAYSNKTNAVNQLNAVKKKGFEAILIQVDGMYKVQVGAYSVKANADNMLAKVKAAGFDAFITTKGGTQVSTSTSNTTSAKTITVGSTVKVKKGAKTYEGKTLASFVYERNHKVKEISGDRVVITYNGTVIAAVKKSDLTLV